MTIKQPLRHLLWVAISIAATAVLWVIVERRVNNHLDNTPNPRD